MIDTKIIKIINHLYEKKDLLEWQETGEHNTYMLAFPNSAIRIGISSYNQETFISIYNSLGDCVSYVDESELNSFEMPDLLKNLRTLYQSAERKVRKVDEVLDEIINEIDKIEDEIPF